MIYDNISPLLNEVDPTLSDEIASRFTAIAGLLSLTGSVTPSSPTTSSTMRTATS